MGVEKFNSTFARLIFGGKIKAALHLLAYFEDSGGGVLPLNAMIDGEKSTGDILTEKLLKGSTSHYDTLLANDNPLMTPKSIPSYWKELMGTLYGLLPCGP